LRRASQSDEQSQHERLVPRAPRFNILADLRTFLFTICRRRVPLALLAVTLAGVGVAPAVAAPTRQDLRFTASDGVSLQATVSGEAPLAARPVIVEFSPYGRNSGTVDAGPAYNFLLVQIRGTGDSDGRFDALGNRTQADVAEVLQWACHKPWSDGRLGLNGFSASAITVYNSLHHRLPCVRTAVLKSGTHELYRDLLSPGGISNIVPGTGVLALIGAPALAQGPDRLSRAPLSGLDTIQGMMNAGLSVLLHPTLDAWWSERGMRGDVNHLPILMIDGFFDVESRGAFQGYQALRRDGAHLMVIGAHDGAPAGTDGGAAETRAWFDHYLSGIANGVERHPKVQLWLADGDREDDLAGRFVRYDGSDWPLPRTRWVSLALDSARSGTAHSLNDGSLSVTRPPRAVTQSYPAIPSLPANTDPANTAIIGGFGFNALATAAPSLTEMTLAEPLGLSYTTGPLVRDVLSAGPAALDLRLSSSAPETGIWAVISDVSPDGTPHPVASGRLLSAYPRIDLRRSLRDPRTRAVVQPYGIYNAKTPALPGQSRLYHVEFWPIGNRFKAGHRLRLHILGASAASLPGAPAVDSVQVGGTGGARLLIPVLPGSELRTAPG
jgi:putative CocE/NonD family hydrolase